MLQESRIMMGMPVSVKIVDKWGLKDDISAVFDYFNYVDHKFSVYKPDSEISKINSGLLSPENYSQDMKQVLHLCEETRQLTRGYFDISRNGRLDPSGLVKGWAINQAAGLLKKRDLENYYIEAGGDIAAVGNNSRWQSWRVGIRNPFNTGQIVKRFKITNRGVATSGTYLRGQHVYDPFHPGRGLTDIVSLTVIGPDIYEADRFATAAFAMGREGIGFIAGLTGFEGYMIDNKGRAIFTPGFNGFVI
jgi:thiamine biosynthesis lipoprotein